MTDGNDLTEDRTPKTDRSPRKAIALHWDRQHAPRVIATGTGLTAENILRIAAEHGVPLQADPVLAEALAQIPLGEEIPAELYLAVAEVLAFVFTLAGIDPIHGAPTKAAPPVPEPPEN